MTHYYVSIIIQYQYFLIEKILKNVFVFGKTKLLHNKQFGSRTNHSTSHALISLTETITNFLNKTKVAGIFIDLEKAFDTVNHSILWDRLHYYGFRGKTNNLIKSFLSNRKQYISLNGYDSSKLNIPCGVPQGSTL